MPLRFDLPRKQFLREKLHWFTPHRVARLVHFLKRPLRRFDRLVLQFMPRQVLRPVFRALPHPTRWLNRLLDPMNQFVVHPVDWFFFIRSVVNSGMGHGFTVSPMPEIN